MVLNVRCLGLHESEVLITWSDKLIETRCVQQYQVYYAKNWPREPLRQIKKKINLANNVVYSVALPNETTTGWYAVGAVLYNGVLGPISAPVYYTYYEI